MTLYTRMALHTVIVHWYGTVYWNDIVVVWGTCTTLIFLNTMLTLYIRSPNLGVRYKHVTSRKI